jgi:hypothetical protein
LPPVPGCNRAHEEGFLLANLHSLPGRVLAVVGDDLVDSPCQVDLLLAFVATTV